MSFAEAAKQRFETGTLSEKKDIILALGSTIYLKNRTLSIELSYPLEMIKDLAPEVKAVHGRLEPVFDSNPCSKNKILEFEYAKNEEWLNTVDNVKTKFYIADVKNIEIMTENMLCVN